jgi:Ca2+-binding EF-hand superfamily protein
MSVEGDHKRMLLKNFDRFDISENGTISFRELTVFFTDILEGME